MITTVIKAQFFEIKGVVKNNLLEPMAMANVSVKDNQNHNTVTNSKGEYIIKIRPGSYELVFSFVGYKTTTIPVTVHNKNIVQNVILEQEDRELQGIRISAKKVDKAEEYVKKVIENKVKYGFSNPYSANVYIKSIETQSRRAVDTSFKNKFYKKYADTFTESNSLNRAEIYMKLYVSPPDKIKEERLAVDIRGNKSGLFYLSHTDGIFNIYKNTIEMTSLSEVAFLSPISHSGLIVYNYKTVKKETINGIKHFTIKITPSTFGNALFSGQIVIQDSTWAITELNLNFPKAHLVEYKNFSIKQKYSITDTSYYLEEQHFFFENNYSKEKTIGHTFVKYSNFEKLETISKKFFNNEVSSTAQEAYEKDSSFWNEIRTEPLTAKEISFLRQTDSIKSIQDQKWWQDSVDKEFNRITIKKIFLTGIDRYNRKKEEYWSFKPLAFVYMPFWIAGERVNYWVAYEREFKNKKTFAIRPHASYGVLNKDIKGGVSLSRLYNPFKRAFFSLSAGSDFGIINPFDAWISILKRSNFYAHDYLFGYHRKELFNGFTVRTGVEYSNRRSIEDYKFKSYGDSLFGSDNTPVSFDFYKAFYGSLRLSYVPFQKYIREPYQKLILGSAWPEIYLNYRKGLPVFGSVVDFDFLEAGLAQDINLKMLGISKYRIMSGKFLNTRDLRLIDYKFQRAAGPILFTHPLYSYQGIDTSYAITQLYLEAHYFHRFNGALLSRIPIIKKLHLIECAGAGFLYTKERNMKYFETFVGLEKVFRLFRDQYKFGLFYVVSGSNNFPILTQFKFTIEGFDKVNNTWNY